MTVNIPGINPRNIFFIFNNIKVYIIEHCIFPRSKEVNAVGLDPIIRPFDSDRGNQRGVFLKTLSSEIYPTLESVSFNGLGTGLTIPTHSIVFRLSP